MWYKNAYRRHLCDMHLTDWDDSFFSEFSPEQYVENLKLAKVQNAMIYFQSHVGLCYYPTECGVMHGRLWGARILFGAFAISATKTASPLRAITVFFSTPLSTTAIPRGA